MTLNLGEPSGGYPAKRLPSIARKLGHGLSVNWQETAGTGPRSTLTSIFVQCKIRSSFDARDARMACVRCYRI